VPQQRHGFDFSVASLYTAATEHTHRGHLDAVALATKSEGGAHEHESLQS
jgi:hypothetical protein